MTQSIGTVLQRPNITLCFRKPLSKAVEVTQISFDGIDSPLLPDLELFKDGITKVNLEKADVVLQLLDFWRSWTFSDIL